MKKEHFSLPLTESQITYYIQKYKNGDVSAREVLILFTMPLVKERVETKYDRIPYSKEELVATGILGLITAIDTFVPDSRNSFHDFALREIDYEIGRFIRKNDYHSWLEHLEEPAVDLEEEYQLDHIFEIQALETQYENKDLIAKLYQWLSTLSERDRCILLLQFGFYGKVYDRAQISKLLNIYPETVNRRTRILLKKFKDYYEGVGKGTREVAKIYKIR